MCEKAENLSAEPSHGKADVQPVLPINGKPMAYAIAAHHRSMKIHATLELIRKGEARIERPRQIEVAAFHLLKCQDALLAALTKFDAPSSSPPALQSSAGEDAPSVGAQPIGSVESSDSIAWQQFMKYANSVNDFAEGQIDPPETLP